MTTTIEPFDPAGLSEEDFLLGPSRDGNEELDIDDIFAKSFVRIYAEQRAYDPTSLEIDEDALWTPSTIDPTFRFVDIEAGLLLIDPAGEPCGGYIGCDVSIDMIHQGRGLGAELILEYAMRCGRLPTWDLDTAAYSNDGYRAHLNAHAMAQNRSLFHRKRDALLAAAKQS